MKKVLFISAALVSASMMFGQRISNVTFEGVSSLGYGASGNPTNNSDSKIGIGFPILLPGTSLDNLTAIINCGADATVSEPNPLPTDWNNPVRIKLQKTAPSTDWAKYDIICRVIKPSALPIEGLFTDAEGKRLSEWTKDTEGFASAGCQEAEAIAKFNSGGRGLFLAFSEAPESIAHTIFVATTTETPGNIFDIDESADGITWTSVVKYTGTGNGETQMSLSSATPAEKRRTHNLKSSTRFVRYWYTTRSAGNITMENLTVDKSTSIASPELLSAKTFIENNELIIASDENIARIQIYSIGGELLKEANNVARINIADLNAGTLLVKVLAENGQSNTFHLGK